jgi:hypothetical protein
MAIENPAGQEGVKNSAEVKASVLHGVKELKIVSPPAQVQGIEG